MAEELKKEMIERYEKQVMTIQKLVEDKKNLQDKLEAIHKKLKDSEKANEKAKKVLEEKF